MVTEQPECSINQSPGQPRLLRAMLAGIAGAGVFALLLVVGSAIVGGKAFGERAATDLAMPVGATWLLLFAGAIASWMRGNRLVSMGFVVAWMGVGLAFNSPTAGYFKQSLSYPVSSDPADSLESPLDAVVLLGGYARINRLGVPELGGDGQRLLLAAQLWHSGKTKTLIVTGTGHLDVGDPADIGHDLLVSVGVPDDVIFKVPGENTAAEMGYLKAYFEAPPASWSEKISFQAPSDSGFDTHQHSVGLVTSAIHMPRALRLAKTQDLQFTPIACRFDGAKPAGLNPRALIPSASAGWTFAEALKEWLAGLVGR